MFLFHRNLPFSTYDKDNKRGCANLFHTPNWHSGCYTMNFFGPYDDSHEGKFSFRKLTYHMSLKEVRWGFRSANTGLYSKIMEGKFRN